MKFGKFFEQGITLFTYRTKLQTILNDLVQGLHKVRFSLHWFKLQLLYSLFIFPLEITFASCSLFYLIRPGIWCRWILHCLLLLHGLTMPGKKENSSMKQVIRLLLIWKWRYISVHLPQIVYMYFMFLTILRMFHTDASYHCCVEIHPFKCKRIVFLLDFT